MSREPGLLFVKMSGAGNDFLVLGPEAVAKLPGDPSDWARRVCRRGLSVGADGVLLVEPQGGGRVGVRFLNPDGTAAFCGNGSRCAARFAHLRGLAGAEMVLETSAGDVPARVEGEAVRIELPPPEDRGALRVDLREETLEGRWIVAGTPHFLVLVDDTDAAPLDRWGPAVRRHPRFAPQGVNVDVVRVGPDGRVRLRTWEKGVERETLACGSGAVAAAALARLGGGGRRVEVRPASGIPLVVEFGADDRVGLSGDARLIFEGRLDAEATRGFSEA
jgi:diaminopimelate epimerase